MLKTSKTKEFCETSFKNGKLSVELTASCQCFLRFFQSTCLKQCPCHEKVRPGHTKCCACQAKSIKIISANLKIRGSKMEPFSGNQRPDLLTALMNMSLVLRLTRKKYIFADPVQMSHDCHRFWKCYKTLPFCSLVTRSTIPCTCHVKRHLNVQKWSKPLCFFNILASKCASCHNGVRFFNISTSKSGPSMVCFAHFDFEMCFAPQRHALFRHLNFQKWSEAGVFCTILTWKCALRHNGVQFFISHLARWLRTCRFSEPTFRPCGATNHWKNTVFRDFPYLFAHLSASFF